MVLCTCRTRQLDPQSCFHGTYRVRAGANELGNCTACSKGGYCDWQNWAQGLATPQNCPKGTYRNMTGAQDESDCTSCPLGFYCPNERTVDAVICPAGTYSNQTRSWECEKCPDGHKCAIGTIKPLPCPPGTSASQGQAVCTPCAAGLFSSDTAKSKCSPCPKGSYCRARADKPILCSKGTFRRDERGSADSDCTFCPMGTFSNMTGASECWVCPNGQSSKRKATDASQCEAAEIILPLQLSAELTPDNVPKRLTEGSQWGQGKVVPLELCAVRACVATQHMVEEGLRGAELCRPLAAASSAAAAAPAVRQGGTPRM